MKFGKKMNLLPENPVYVGDRQAVEMELSIIAYDSKSAQMKSLSGVDELAQFEGA